MNSMLYGIILLVTAERAMRLKLLRIEVLDDACVAYGIFADIRDPQIFLGLPTYQTTEIRLKEVRICLNI